MPSVCTALMQGRGTIAITDTWTKHVVVASVKNNNMQVLFEFIVIIVRDLRGQSTHMERSWGFPQRVACVRPFVFGLKDFEDLCARFYAEEDCVAALERGSLVAGWLRPAAGTFSSKTR